MPPSITEIERGVWRLKYQNPDRQPARARLVAAARHPVVKWLGSRVDMIIFAVIVAAILAWFGIG